MISTEKIGQKDVIIVNCENYTIDKSGDVARILAQASALVAQSPEKSVYIITVVKNIKFNSEISEAFKKYAFTNTPYVKESVIAGMGGLQAVVFAVIKAITKRDFHLVDTLEDAKRLMETL